MVKGSLARAQKAHEEGILGAWMCTRLRPPGLGGIKSGVLPRGGCGCVNVMNDEGRTGGTHWNSISRTYTENISPIKRKEFNTCTWCEQLRPPCAATMIPRPEFYHSKEEYNEYNRQLKVASESPAELCNVLFTRAMTEAEVSVIWLVDGGCAVVGGRAAVGRGACAMCSVLCAGCGVHSVF
jgi:hypothetical protein